MGSPSESDVAMPAAASMPLLSQPIPFVMLSDDSTFEIAPEAVAYLKQIKGAVAVVSIAGLYRTGKSYMLNLLLGRDRAEAMFSVGSTVNACTKGIWIWGQPVQLSAVADLAAESAFKHLPKDTTIVFMDTEGLGSVQRSQTQDTRIFALALLLSSLFIYNSRGVIDSSAIEDLSLVVHLTKFIQAKAHAPSRGDGGDSNGSDSDDTDSSELAAFFPDFLWVVRDFTLRLQEDGRKVTPREYFESALKHQPPLTDEIAQKNRIRTLLATFFPTRDCVTMVRPLNDESLLRDLINQPYESLRPEFREQMAVLKTKVFGALKPKRVMASALNGAMLVALAQNYVDAFNSGSSPVIATVWDRVLESQCDEALESAKAAFTRHFESAMATSNSVQVSRQVLPQPLDEATLNELYEQARAVAERELEREDLASISSMTEYFEQLSEFMLAALRESYDKAERDSVAFNRALLAELYEPQAASRVSSSSDSDGTQRLQTVLADSHARIDEAVAKYRERARGVAASAVLSDFLAEKLVDGLVDWGAAVKVAFRAQETTLESDVAALKQTLRSIDGKIRAAEELLAQQRESYERALRSIAERTEDERRSLQDEIAAKQADIDRTQLQIEQLTLLHKDALAQLDAQLEEAKAERRRLEDSLRETQARRESERQDVVRQLLESERSFHREEKDLLQSQQQLLQRIIALEQQLGELDTEQMLETLRLEQASQQHETKLTCEYARERDTLKQYSVEEIRALKSKQDDELAALNSELNEQKALLSALREQIETRSAIVEMRRAKVSAFFGGKEDCVLQ